VTLDYTRKYWNESKLEWHHVNDFIEEIIASKTLELYKNAATFSSIEHTGLGRFGDPLNPGGVLEVMQQVLCMLKPGILFFVGALEFNAQRIYGTERLELLFRGWEILSQKQAEFVLKKTGDCV